MGVARRRQRERERRRTSILDAADAVFRRKGVAQATMDDIAAEAELSKGALYLYFKSKEDLFVELASRFLDGLASRFEAVANRARIDGIAAITEVLTHFAASIAAQPHMFRTMVSSLASGEMVACASPVFDRHRALKSRVLGAFASVITAGIRNGTLRADVDPLQTALRMWGGLLGIMLVRLNAEDLSRRSPQTIDADALIPGFLDLICNGLRPRALPSTSMETSE